MSESTLKNNRVDFDTQEGGDYGEGCGSFFNLIYGYQISTKNEDCYVTKVQNNVRCGQFFGRYHILRQNNFVDKIEEYLPNGPVYSVDSENGCFIYCSRCCRDKKNSFEQIQKFQNSLDYNSSSTTIKINTDTNTTINTTINITEYEV